MTTIWRLQTNTDSKTGRKIGNYCIENSILAVGWSLKDDHLSGLSEENKKAVIEYRKNIVSFNDYEKINNKYCVYAKNGKGNPLGVPRRLAQDLNPNDLIWIRQDGIYYLGRVSEESKWIYNFSDEALDLDASNQVSNIKWVKVGDESSVPGALTTAFIKGSTIQRIWKDGIQEFSKLIYNKKVGTNYYDDVKLEYNIENFYSLLSTDDCEDLLCLWLYNEYGYVVIPSTNKKSTELYECVLKNPNTGQNIYIQVKSGNVDISTEIYKDLPGEVWLFTTKGKITGEKFNNIKIASSKELFEFVKNDCSNNLLPESIKNWNELLSQNETK